MNQINIQYHKTKIGELILGSFDGKLCLLDFRYRKMRKTVRAVANANGANAIGIIIPSHRIIGSDGKLVGYGGGLPVKKRLLKLEKSHFNGQEMLFA